MLYSEFMKKAEELVLTTDEDSGLSFLEPDYYAIMKSVNMDPEEDIFDIPISWDQFVERMELQADKLNKLDDRSKYVMDWMFQVLTSAIEPAMVQEENELFKNMTEYMNRKHELAEKEKELQLKENTLGNKQSVVQLMPGMNFSKKGPNRH